MGGAAGPLDEEMVKTLRITARRTRSADGTEPSVWGLVLRLVVLPAVVAAVLAGALASQRYDELQAALRARDAARALVAMANVHRSVANEALAVLQNAGAGGAVEKDSGAGLDSETTGVLDAALEAVPSAPHTIITASVASSRAEASRGANPERVVAAYDASLATVESETDKQVESLYRYSAGDAGRPHDLVTRLRALQASDGLLAHGREHAVALLASRVTDRDAAPDLTTLSSLDEVGADGCPVGALGDELRRTATPALWSAWCTLGRTHHDLDSTQRNPAAPSENAVDAPDAGLLFLRDLIDQNTGIRTQAVADVLAVTETSYTRSRDELVALASVVIASAAALGLICRRTARRISAPLRALAARALAMSRGDLLLGSEGGTHETAVVAAALNDTTRALRRLEDDTLALGVALSGQNIDVTTHERKLGGSVEQAVHRISELQAELIEQAMTDPATGLGNRRAADRHLRALADQGPLTVFALEVVGLRDVYELRGHETKEDLLRRWSAHLKERAFATSAAEGAACGGRAGVFRIGDDVLVVMLPFEPDEERLTVLSRQLGSLDHSVQMKGDQPVRGAEARVALSAGTCCEDGPNRLEQALYCLRRSRHEGVTSPLRYDALVHATRSGEAEMLSALRKAIEHDELSLVYQPEWDLRTGRVSGAECLVRWRRDAGPVPPDVFVTLAERNDCVEELDRWVLQRAGQQLRAWSADPAHDGLLLAVNVSGLHLQRYGVLTRMVAEALAETGAPAHRLVLEITETALIDVHRSSAEELRQLRALGVQLALDDFGTGYCSIQQLSLMPLDYLKIDKSFVAGLGDTAGTATSLVPLMVSAAHRSGLRVIAEGVETQEQLNTLRFLGCDLAQGYLFAEPLSDRAFHRLVTRSVTLANSRPEPLASTGLQVLPRSSS